MVSIIMSCGYNNLKGLIGTIDSYQNISKYVVNYINYRKRFTQCRFQRIGSYCWKGCYWFLIENELSGKKLHKDRAKVLKKDSISPLTHLVPIRAFSILTRLRDVPDKIVGHKWLNKIKIL